MPAPSDSDHVERLSRRPILGPADPEALARAAEILRDRTMSLEDHEPWPSRRLVVSLIVATALVAMVLIVFRAQVKAFLGIA